MQFSLLSLALSVAVSSSAAVAHSLTLFVPPSPPKLPNPLALPPTTHATLSSLGESHTARLTPENTFVFRNLSASASYLLDVHAHTHAFVPYRIDVGEDGSLYAWETYRGNDWGNKGEEIRGIELGEGAEGKGFEVRVAGPRGYFIERSKFSVVNIVMKNPMILIGLVTMGIVFGMPYLMKNMDPEMRAEFEERQRDNPLNSLLSGAAGQGAGGGAAGGQGFDIAGFLAGSSGQQQGQGQGQGQSGSGGKKKEGGRR